MMRQAIILARSLLFYFGYVLATLLVSLICFLVVWFIPKNKRYIFAVVWCKFILMWLRLTCGIRYHIEGLDNLPASPVVVLANHQSEWETLFLYTYLAPICPILKKELLDIPFWGWALRLQRPIAIDRGRPHEAGKYILDQGTIRIRDGLSVIIFPEGTRAHVERIKKFSRGGAKLAIAAGAPILPVAHNAGHCWPPRTMLKYPGTISIAIGSPLASGGGNASELTDSAEAWIRQQLSRWAC